MYRLAIFDLDGTLVDSLEDLAASYNEVLTAMGCPVYPVESYRQFVGNGLIRLAEDVLPADRQSDADIKRFCDMFAEVYSRRYAENTRPYPGMTELIAKLSSGGVYTAVVSNKPHEFARRIVHEMFGDTFTEVCGKTDDMPKKPAPDLVLAIMERCGVQPDDAVMVGDSSVDIQTGQNAGIHTIGCTWGFRGRDELTAAGAEHLADTADDLYRIIMAHQR